MIYYNLQKERTIKAAFTAIIFRLKSSVLEQLINYYSQYQGLYVWIPVTLTWKGPFTKTKLFPKVLPLF